MIAEQNMIVVIIVKKWVGEGLSNSNQYVIPVCFDSLTSTQHDHIKRCFQESYFFVNVDQSDNNPEAAVDETDYEGRYNYC